LLAGKTFEPGAPLPKTQFCWKKNLQDLLYKASHCNWKLRLQKKVAVWQEIWSREYLTQDPFLLKREPARLCDTKHLVFKIQHGW